MSTRNISVTLEKAREWYNSGNATLKEIALQAFNENELKYNFRDIKTYLDACEALGLSHDDTPDIEAIAKVSRASAAMTILNIVRKALNMGQDLHLTEDPKYPKKSYIWYPYNPFITINSFFYRDKIKTGRMEVIGKIKNEGTIYSVLGGTANQTGSGLGNFGYYSGVGDAKATSGFLGCASREIAEHFGKYFGMLITEAKYGDMVDFEIIEELH